ncbi:uncharacterized protein LY89DRAFT_727055 [Mollisia scopiformis]|uniref:T6SS Phospholipase effector Tle1-like catalytic domain-containing protein n=1 Tax=Mollisia scopiformis TaxID=149040 RepID=A0A194XUL0_MOLSC|nr:uncharacterized protein LY89DRAFT_727055 [Mollisia scopiformis]KUJ24005.1 hypothetical protein LY89DRAFT_727055 [Mollisia scopiformis]
MSNIPLTTATTQSNPTRTWVVGVLSSRKTVVSEFVRLISEHENVFEIPVNGVGSDVNWVDWIVGGVGSWGTLQNVITAFSTNHLPLVICLREIGNISRHYIAGDRIIVSGYSRGAWAARYLAMLIDMIGLPKDGDEALFHRLYKACDNATILDESVAARLMEGYDCWQDVKINALCCFDTVGSFGLPLTGLAEPLAYLT